LWSRDATSRAITPREFRSTRGCCALDVGQVRLQIDTAEYLPARRNSYAGRHPRPREESVGRDSRLPVCGCLQRGRGAVPKTVAASSCYSRAQSKRERDPPNITFAQAVQYLLQNGVITAANEPLALEIKNIGNRRITSSLTSLGKMLERSHFSHTTYL
jgi:hypothetical protein